MNALKNFLRDESGIDTLEYAVVAALVTAVAVLVYGSGWGQSVKNMLMKASTAPSGSL